MKLRHRLNGGSRDWMGSASAGMSAYRLGSIYRLRIAIPNRDERLPPWWSGANYARSYPPDCERRAAATVRALWATATTIMVRC